MSFFAQHASAIQAISAVVSVVATIALVVVTALYVGTTRHILRSGQLAGMREFEPLIVVDTLFWEPSGYVSYVLRNIGKGTAVVAQQQVWLDPSGDSDTCTNENQLAIGAQSRADGPQEFLFRPLREGDLIKVRVSWQNAFGNTASSESCFRAAAGKGIRFGEVSIVGSVFSQNTKPKKGDG